MPLRPLSSDSRSAFGGTAESIGIAPRLRRFDRRSTACNGISQVRWARTRRCRQTGPGRRSAVPSARWRRQGGRLRWLLFSSPQCPSDLGWPPPISSAVSRADCAKALPQLHADLGPIKALAQTSWDAEAMRRRSPLAVASVLVMVCLVSTAVAFVGLPGLFVKDARFKDGEAASSSEEKRLKARNDVRTATIQLVGAMALIVGGALTWRTVWLTREGQVTDRLASAVERLGSDDVHMRVAAIYALGRVARDSRADHSEVMTLLGEHLRRTHPAVGPDDRRVRLESRLTTSPEVRAVAMVLRARRCGWDPQEPRLNFSRIDFRSAPLQKVDLRRADLRKANFRGAFLSDANLAGARMSEVTLRAASLQRCNLRAATLKNADLTLAHAEWAGFRDVSFDEATWEGTELGGADLRGATGVRRKLPTTAGLVTFDPRTTIWPWDKRWGGASLLRHARRFRQHLARSSPARWRL